MKKIFSLLLVLFVASSVLAQEQPGELTLTGKNQIDENGVFIQGGTLVVGQTVTDADNGKTITLHVGEKLFVDLPNDRHFVSGDWQCGLESVSTVSFDGLSNPGVLAVEQVDLGDQPVAPNNKNFEAVAIGYTTLAYKRTMSYVGYGNVPVPMCVMMGTTSFNIVVTE